MCNKMHVFVYMYAACIMDDLIGQMLHYDDVTGLVSESISIFPVISLLLFMGSLPLFLCKVGLKLLELLLFFIGGSLLRGILSVGGNVEGGDKVYENGLG